MVCSGYGAFALALNFLAMACAFTSLLTPLWISNHDVDTSYDGVVKEADTNFGVWVMCFDVKWDDTATLVKGDKQASNFNIKDCYAYYNALERTIARFDGKLTFDKYSTSVCDHYNSNPDRASGALGVMAGMRKDSMHNFLDKTCSTSGKTVLAMMIGTSVCLGVSFILLFFGICCCDTNSCMIQMTRYLAVFASIFSAVLSFFVFSQFTQLRYDKAGYNVSLYLEIAAFVLTLILAWAIEQHILRGKPTSQDQL